VEYIVFGKEVGASGTPHLQGTVIFNDRKRRSQAIRVIGQAHFTVTHHLNESVEYCKKDGDWTEVGECPQEKATRCDLEAFKQSVHEGIYDHDELAELHSKVWAMYRDKFCIEYISKHLPREPVPLHSLRPWQQIIFHELELLPDPRKIIFIVDEDGDKGKSWLAKYYRSIHEKNTQIVKPCKTADMAYIIKETTRVFFFDLARSRKKYLQYDFLEELKDREVMSPKYHTRLVQLCTTPHIVVLMNHYPDITALSVDRYLIYTICDENPNFNPVGVTKEEQATANLLKQNREEDNRFHHD
jgi:Putative viral replication protein